MGSSIRHGPGAKTKRNGLPHWISPPLGLQTHTSEHGKEAPTAVQEERVCWLGKALHRSKPRRMLSVDPYFRPGQRFDRAVSSSTRKTKLLKGKSDNMPIYEGQSIMRRLLEQESAQMMTELLRIRESFTHGGNRGGEAEATIREFFRKHLPLHFRVGHGEVFNKDGRRSRQTDVVVINQDHPPLFSDWERANMFIIEGVAAGGEVKTALQSVDDLRETFDKGTAFKCILVQPQAQSMMFGKDEDIARFVNRRPYFAFFFESKLGLKRIKQELDEWNNELREIERPSIDAVFVLDRGSIIHFGNGDGTLKLRLPDGTEGRGYHIRTDHHERVLPSILLWIFTSMPRVWMWTPPIVDYLIQEEAGGELSLDDNGRLSRTLPPKRV